MKILDAPMFVGSHFVEFTDGSARLMVLQGAILDTMGRPIYLVDDEDKVYNYANVISTKKRLKITNG